MSHNDHDHHHGGHGHNHDHEHDHSDEATPALQTLIYKQIDFDKVRTLNESVPDAGIKVVQKPWAERMHPEPELVSDADEQLLMFVPYVTLLYVHSKENVSKSSVDRFTGSLKLHSFLIRTSSDASAPRTLKLFANKDDLDFSGASDLNPTQSFELPQTSDIQEHPVKRTLFGNTYSLTLFIEDNYGDEITRISWIGFKGDFTNLSREPVEVLYEKAANPKDHDLIVGVGEKGMSGTRHGM